MSVTRQGIRVLAAAGLIAGLALAGCTGTPTPESTTSSSGSAPTSSGSVPSDVPTVPSPGLDTERFAANPCGLLTEAQLKSNQVAAGVKGTPRESPLGPSCTWAASGTPANSYLVVTVNNQLGGIAQLYAQKSNFAMWEPVQVAGYPAVIALDSAARGLGVCRVNIGTSQKTLVAVDVSLDQAAKDRADACPRTRAIGEMVIATLKGGG